jgi:hypothetical protein
MNRHEHDQMRHFYEVVRGRKAPGPPPYMLWQRLVVFVVIVALTTKVRVELGWVGVWWGLCLIPFWVLLGVWTVIGDIHRRGAQDGRR